MVAALAAHLMSTIGCIHDVAEKARVAAGGGMQQSERVPTILELGAGSGVLSQRLADLLGSAARVVATDSGLNRIGGVWSGLEKMDSRRALQKYRPDIVLVCWMPRYEYCASLWITIWGTSCVLTMWVERSIPLQTNCTDIPHSLYGIFQRC